MIGLLVGVVVVLAWPTSGAGDARTHGERSAVAPPVASSRAEAEAADVLRSWDRRRASAWAAGDAASLAELYIPGASAGEADVAMLRDWAARGLAVDGLTTQLLSVRVVAQAPRRWVLRVRDRVAGGVAAGPGFTEPLPDGAVAEREVELRRWAGGWRVASVRPARSAARR